MIKAHTRDGHGTDGLDGTRGIPAPAHAALQHDDVERGLGKDHAGSHRQQVELRDVVGTLPR